MSDDSNDPDSDSYLLDDNSGLLEPIKEQFPNLSYGDFCQNIFLGAYVDEEVAAGAYDLAALKYRAMGHS